MTVPAPDVSGELTIVQKGGGKAVSITLPQDRPKTELDEFHEQKKQAHAEILTEFACKVHSLPGKPVACYADLSSGLCYPITDQNQNL